MPAVHTDHPDEGSTTGFHYDGSTFHLVNDTIVNFLETFDREQRTLQDQELLSPVSIVNSLETQDQYLGERSVIGHRGQYLCKICGDGFAQPQGVRWHHLEKHEPKTCLHCHTFKWGRLYLFKKHLREAHPYEDTEPSTLATAKGGHRKSLTTNSARIHSCPTLRVHHGLNRHSDTTQRQMTLSLFAEPELQPASSLESQAETISIIDNDVRDEACVICEMRTGSGCLSTAAPRL
ncbi:hypothetical protein EDB83DRAFT_2314465 [Lactarius deliciosus]|nr:hypothetical protein EDB83DRAFT_2314465 [Lactarius deliciosus]